MGGVWGLRDSDVEAEADRLNPNLEDETRTRGKREEAERKDTSDPRGSHRHGGAARPGPCMRPPYTLQPTPPPKLPPPPPPRVLTDSWGVGRIRTAGSRPPVVTELPVFCFELPTACRTARIAFRLRLGIHPTTVGSRRVATFPPTAGLALMDTSSVARIM